MRKGGKIIKKPVEKSKKNGLNLKKIKINPEKKLKNGVNFQFRPFVTCPLPLRPPLKRDIIEGKTKTKEYKPYWEKRVGNEKFTILGHPVLGFPYGQDNLIILFLIKKALEQNNNGLIEFKSLNNFLKIFNFSRGGDTYKKTIRGFKRLYNASFDYAQEKIIEKNKIRQERFSFKMISSWSVSFSEFKGQLEMFNNYIRLSKDFWELVKKFKIPYNLNIVKKLKQSPATVNLYILLSYRSYTNWHNEKREIFIPFFGENGLQNQLSSDIARKRDFKIRIIKHLGRMEKYWPDCPVYLKKETDSKKKGPTFNKIYKDGLFIHVKKASQLSIDPHWDKILRQAREEAKALPKTSNEKF